MRLIERGEPVALTDIVLTEVFQGIRHDSEAARVHEHLRAFPILRLRELEDFAFAAELYRGARRCGVTIRRTLDCLIAAPCIRAGASLLHRDSDFDLLATCSAVLEAVLLELQDGGVLGDRPHLGLVEASR